MALTPDDVVTKQFQHVRFKEGFDPDEVDDFLDEIVVEWRKTVAENIELKAKLAAYEAAGAPVAAAPVAAPLVEEVPVVAPEPEPEPEPVVAEPAPVETPATVTSAGIIELAQRLHDEYVADGETQRDQLISEARAQAASIVAEAEAQSREERARLDNDRSTLESRINDLRQFERDYRAQLKATLEEKLRDLDVVAS